MDNDMTSLHHSNLSGIFVLDGDVFSFINKHIMKTFPGLDGTELLRVISPWVLTKCNTIRVNLMKEEFEPDYQGDAMDKDPLQIWLCLVETWQQTISPCPDTSGVDHSDEMVMFFGVS